MVHMLHGHAVNFDDILSKKPYSVNEQVSTLKGKHVKGGHEGLLCNYSDVINVDDQWGCQAWDHVRALLRDRLRKKFRKSSSNLLDVRKLNGKREVCAPPHIRSILPADDKEREMYNICKRVVTILEPYGELMGSDLKVHPYQGRLIPWKSIEVLSMELRYFFDTLRETYRLDGSASETEASENFIEDMAVSLAGEVKRAVFEIGFYSSSFCSPPSTSSPAQKDSTSAVLDGM